MTRKARTMLTLGGLIVASAVFNGCATAPSASQPALLADVQLDVPVTAFCAFASITESADVPAAPTDAVTFHLGAGDELGTMVFEYMLVLGAFDTESAGTTVYVSAEPFSD